MTLVDAVAGVPLDVPWGTRMREDGLRASALQSSVQRKATATILQRALAVGAEAVVLTGSTVRARRTAISDLDFMVVGERPDLGGVDEDIDVYAAGAESRELLLAAIYEMVIFDCKGSPGASHHTRQIAAISRSR